MNAANTLIGRRSSPPRRPAQSALPASEPVDLKDAYCPKYSGVLALGSTVLAGLSLLGTMGQPHPAPEIFQEIEQPTLENVCLARSTEMARVIIVDDFTNADKVTTHGEIVETELTRYHRTTGEHQDISLERAQVSVWDGEHGIKEGKPGALDSYLRAHFAGRMDRDAKALEQIVNSGGPRGVVHQSQGASESRAVDAIYYRALREADFGRALLQQVGLQPSNLDTDDQRREFLSRLVQRADAIYSQDNQVKESRGRLRDVQDRLDEKGYIHVISAGNQGYLYRDMLRLGVEIPADFFTNDFAGSHSIIVGAADNQSQELDSQNFRVADLASPNAGAHIAADGVDRPMTVDGKSEHHSGSSYAAPQVSSTVLDMLRLDPGLTRDQALARLQSSAKPVDNAQSYLGAGVLQQPEMLICNH